MLVAIVCEKYKIPVNYLRYLRIAGINPVIVRRFCDIPILAQCDGIVFSGGGDVFPLFFKKTNIGCDFDIYRDLLEKRIFALFGNKPILGICRGMQSINVFCGGTLKEVSGHFNTVHTISSRKVYSLHHQAIDRLADRFTIVSSIDSVIEEAVSNKTILVQYHPERTVDGHILFLFKNKIKSEKYT